MTRIIEDGWSLQVSQLGDQWVAEARRGRTQVFTCGHRSEAAARAALLADTPGHWTEVRQEILGGPPWKMDGGGFVKSTHEWRVTVSPTSDGTGRWFAMLEVLDENEEVLDDASTRPLENMRLALDRLAELTEAWAPDGAIRAMRSEVPQ